MTRNKPGPGRPRIGVRTLARDASSELAEAVKPKRAPSAPTLASIVQQQITNDISQGLLSPGSRLEEKELARRYRVSRTPVREALRQLSALGIVEMRHRQGMVAAERSMEHFNNLLEVVADLEASSARYAALRMTDAERQQLQAVHEQMWEIAQQSARSRFDKENISLHQLIHKGARNEILLNGILQMRMRTLPYTRMEFISERRRLEISYMEHNSIVYAIMRREPEAAYHAMRMHVIDAAQVHEDLSPA